MSSQPVRIGILGASSIAQTSIIAPAKLLSDKVVIAAIAARDLSRAKVYAETHGIPRVFASYEELIADRDIDAVYISLPIAYHAKYAVLAIEHGKHVLSETPSSANEDETRQILAALSKKNAEDASKKVQYFVGYHWRSHPVQRRVRELLKSGRIGTLQHVELKMILPAAWFPVRTGSIFFQYATGGGAGIDLGSYPVNTVLFSLGDPVNARFKVIDAKPSFDPELD
ncbi:NAD(P)-binding protein, partial [Ramicandelaber brevisporus]